MSEARKATIVSTSTAILLFFMKAIIGFLSGSVAVLASAIDSVLDILTSIFNFFAIKTAELPPNENFNYGKGKIEALAALIEGVIITLSGFYVMYEGVKKFISEEQTQYLNITLLVMIISIIITLILVAYLKKVAKKTGNLVIKSDALHYETDLLSSGGITLSLLLVYLSGYEIIDAIVAIIVAIYIIYSAYGLIKNGVFILLDASLNNDLTEQIVDIINSQEEVKDFHLLRSRTAAGVNFLDVHLVFSPQISLIHAHNISDVIEDKVRLLDAKKTWDINIHHDPHDDLKEDKELLEI